MLSLREEIILSSIVRQYIDKAAPVSSASVIEDCNIDVCPATVRNDVARLEQEGYIIRPHHAAGSIPSNKAYRYYVESLERIELPLTERFLINHLFHQIEREMDEWLSLAVSLIARRAHNVAVISAPKSNACRFHYLELVALQDQLALAVLVLKGAKVKQQLVSFPMVIEQETLNSISNRLNQAYQGLTRSKIQKKKMELSEQERLITDSIVKLMKAEDELEQDDSYLDGLHYLLEQPEFQRSDQAQPLMEIVERRKLGQTIAPQGITGEGIRVMIGQENKDEAIQNYSVVIGRYGLPEKAEGTIGVVGPTRMHYDHAIAAIGYLSLVMSRLVAELYGERQLEGT